MLSDPPRSKNGTIARNNQAASGFIVGLFTVDRYKYITGTFLKEYECVFNVKSSLRK